MTFKPGQSGNPGGRPKKGFSIRENLRGMMSEEVVIPGKDGKPDTVMTKGAIISAKLFQAAAQGDLTAIKMCLDNIDGPPTQSVEITNDGAGVVVDVTVVDATLRERLDSIAAKSG